MSAIIAANLELLSSTGKQARAIYSDHRDEDRQFSKTEIEKCDEFLSIATNSESTCNVFWRLAIKSHSQGEILDYTELSNALKGMYYELHERLFPFIQSLKDKASEDGSQFPHFERFEMSKQNLECKIAEYENEEDELEDIAWRQKAESIALTIDDLTKLSERFPAPQEWYDE